MRLKFWKQTCPTCKDNYINNGDEVCQTCKDDGWALETIDIGNYIFRNTLTGNAIYIPSSLLSINRL